MSKFRPLHVNYMFQFGQIILVQLTVVNVFPVFYCIFLCPQNCRQKGGKKKGLGGCEEYVSACTRLDASSHSKLNAQLPFPCSRCRFVYGLSICGVLPEAHKNFNSTNLNSPGRSS